ncbi:MAG: InlB B-repeat-containing protein, partial [Anaeroplasma bactoclasticum]|nr:InlB B-repeat-containing protein [Anaeroplasma bactoclasticum]
MMKMRKRLFVAVATFGILLILSACTTLGEIKVSLDATYEVTEGQTIEIAPLVTKDGAEYQTALGYVSLDTSIAKFVDGKLIGVKPGQVRIKVYAVEQPKAYATALVTVTDNNLLSATFDIEQEMNVNEIQQIHYQIIGTELQPLVNYRSSNEQILTVDENGTILAKSEGSATVTIRLTSVSDPSIYREYKYEIKISYYTYSIEYVLNGGKNHKDNPKGVHINQLPVTLYEPTKAGYDFVGWYDNAEFINQPITIIEQMENEQIQLFAKWEKIDYTIEYNLNGGTNHSDNPLVYNIETDTITLFPATKSYYTFDGWYIGDIKVETIQKGTIGNQTLTAKYTPIEYTITYDLDGGMTTNQNYYTIESETIVLSDAAKANYHFIGWFDSENHQVTEIPAGTTGNIELTAYYVAIDYAIEYVLNGGINQEDNPSKYNVETNDILLLAPTKVGYTFLGWLNENNEQVTEIKTGSIGNITLVANWEADTYTVTFDSNEGSSVDSIEYTIESKDITFATPEKTGYTFLGWLNENNEQVTEIKTGSTGNITLVAKWDLSKYTIDFDLDGGEFDTYIYRNREEAAAAFLQDFNNFANASYTTVAGYWKDGQKTAFWKNEQMRSKWLWIWDEIKVLSKAQGKDTQYIDNIISGTSYSGYATQNVALYLLGINNDMWISTYSATYGSLSSKWTAIDATNTTIELKGEIVTAYTIKDSFQLPLAAKEGYTFLGWLNENNEQVTEIKAGSTGNITLVAKWDLSKYTIDFDLDGGEFDTYIYRNREEAAAAFLQDFNNFANASYTTVAGYWKDGQKTAFWKNEQMRSKWLWIWDEIKVLSKAQGKDTQYIDNIISGTSYSGYATQNVALYLLGINNDMWISTYSATYGSLSSKWTAIDATNTTIELKQDVLTNYSPVDQIELPKGLKEGYTFLGWFNENNEQVTVIEKGSTGNLTLTAKWEVITYEILLDADGGRDVENITFTVESDLIELPATSKQGYTFLGWFDENGELVTTIETGTVGNLTLKAKYQLLTYTIQYAGLNDGDNANNPTEYTVESGSIVLQNPILSSGYIFEGWYDENDEFITTIESETKRNLVVKAKLREYTIQEVKETTNETAVFTGTITAISVLSSQYNNFSILVNDGTASIMVYRISNAT